MYFTIVLLLVAIVAACLVAGCAQNVRDHRQKLREDFIGSASAVQRGEYNATPSDTKLAGLEAVHPKRGHVDEADENEWDAWDRKHKFSNGKHPDPHSDSNGELQSNTDAEPQMIETGFFLEQVVPSVIEQVGRGDDAALKERVKKLNQSGHCQTIDAVWSAMQHRSIACPAAYATQNQQLQKQEAHHPALVYASVDADTSVGTILSKFKYSEEQNGAGVNSVASVA